MFMRVMKTPKKLDLELTTHCNLSCRYCSHFTSPGDVSGDLPTEEWLRFFGELKRCAVLDVTLSGGEPFCRKDLKELIQGIVQNRMRFAILSNGTLITDEMAEFIAKTGRCDYVQVSIDGSRPEVHDSFRGEGCFEKAVRGLSILRKHGVRVAVRVTIHRKNVDDLEATARFLLEELELPSFSTNAASFLGICREHAEEVQMRTEDRTKVMQTLLKLTRKYPNRISANAGPLSEARHWTAMDKAVREGQEHPEGYGHLVGCGCTFQKLAVRADGVIVPCSHLSQMELGRINQDDLTLIWQSHPTLHDLRKRREISLESFEHCQGCQYIPFCTGNCPGIAYTTMDNVNHPCPHACLRNFLNDGGRLPHVPQ